MTQVKKISVGAINITTHPHSSENYIELLNFVFNNEFKGKIHGSSWGTIGSLRPQQIQNQTVLFGTIFRYLNIDPNSDWLNTDTREPIVPEEDATTKPLSDNLKPHLKYISYLFLPQHHRFFFETSDITPGSMRNFLKDIFGKESVLENFGDVDISIESTKEAIVRILSIPRLTRLEIHFNRPNADDLSDLEYEQYEQGQTLISD